MHSLLSENEQPKNNQVIKQPQLISKKRMLNLRIFLMLKTESLWMYSWKRLNK